MSYHLKELGPLVEQSERGKYCLSEVGQAGVELFEKLNVIVKGQVLLFVMKLRMF